MMSLPSGLLPQIDELTAAQSAALRESPDHTDTTTSGPRDPEWVEAWLAEVERRSQAMDEGREETLSWEQVKARLDAARASRQVPQW